VSVAYYFFKDFNYLSLIRNALSLSLIVKF
jgi:hypothetical protein